MAKNHGGKVILVVIEDMCPAAIESNRTPNLEILINTGAATMNAEANDLHLWGMPPLFGILAGRRAPGGGAFAFREDAIAEARYSISALAGTLGRSVAGYHKNARLARLRYFGIPDCLYTPQPENATGSFSRNLRRTVVSAANDIISFRPDYCLIHLGCE